MLVRESYITALAAEKVVKMWIEIRFVVKVLTCQRFQFPLPIYIGKAVKICHTIF